MAKKSKEYKLKIKRGPFFRIFKKIIRLFSKTPEVINLGEEPLKDQAIYISNHQGASGPMKFETYFPKTLTPWGIYNMNGNYKVRWKYLYYVFYQQKLHWGKFKAFNVATIFAIFSIHIYRAIGLISTYQDARLLTTFRNSTKVLDAGSALLIFPEDSSKGYLEPPQAFNKGYLMMAKKYYQHAEVDLPIYPMYYGKKIAKMVVGKPLYVNQLLRDGYSDDEINTMFLKECQRIYHEYIEVK